MYRFSFLIRNRLPFSPTRHVPTIRLAQAVEAGAAEAVEAAEAEAAAEVGDIGFKTSFNKIPLFS